jgi:hypothetical protein
MRETRFRFEGGPLADVVRRKTSPSRHPFYREASSGDPLPATHGDRFKRDMWTRTELYELDRFEKADDGARVAIYIHRTRP